MQKSKIGKSNQKPKQAAEITANGFSEQVVEMQSAQTGKKIKIRLNLFSNYFNRLILYALTFMPILKHINLLIKAFFSFLY